MPLRIETDLLFPVYVSPVSCLGLIAVVRAAGLTLKGPGGGGHLASSLLLEGKHAVSVIQL